MYSIKENAMSSIDTPVVCNKIQCIKSVREHNHDMPLRPAKEAVDAAILRDDPVLVALSMELEKGQPDEYHRRVVAEYQADNAQLRSRVDEYRVEVVNQNDKIRHLQAEISELRGRLVDANRKQENAEWELNQIKPLRDQLHKLAKLSDKDWNTFHQMIAEDLDTFEPEYNDLSRSGAIRILSFLAYMNNNIRG